MNEPRSLCAHRSRTFADEMIGIAPTASQVTLISLSAGASVEKDYRATTIAKRPGPDFQAVFLADAASLTAEFVLIDGNDFLIRENLFDLGRHGAHIVAGHRAARQAWPRN